jgi:hypothetical protein
MPSRLPLFSMFLLLFASIVSDGQTTATCTNWSLFALPSPWVSTVASGISRWGTVVGLVFTAYPSHIHYGFIRYSNGSSKTYMAPNANYTEFTRRNALGVTVGSYNSNGLHGLVLSGTSLATVDYPGAERTQLSGINYWGSIVGNYFNQDGTFGAFKLKNGVFTPISYPGSVDTLVASISDKGVIVGHYHVYQPPYFHGFVLTNGVYKTLDYPNATGGTYPEDINSSGMIVGEYRCVYRSGGYCSDGTFVYSNGTFKDIVVPKYGPAITASGINGYGYVTGIYASGINSYTAHCQ